MAIVPTYLTVTPTFANKQVSTVGTIAVNEKVALTVVGVVDIAAPVVPPGLVLRLTSPSGATEYARFPFETGDTWTISGADVTCDLLLNTEELQALFLYQCANVTKEAKILLESGTTDNLYAEGRLLIRNWVQNPVDPTAGTAKIQAQIDVISGLLETHQHDDDAEGESDFPHNNLSDRDAAGVHPTIEAGIVSAASVAAQALSEVQTLENNTEAARDLATLMQDDGVFTKAVAADSPGDVKLLLNALITVLNTWRES
jgi:hypothetical protein